MTQTDLNASNDVRQTARRGWRTVRFGEIAEHITDKVNIPSEAGVERYVGLEHLDPESLKIRRWGVPTDVEATKLRFKPGDIIFGRRRAYQRKVAVADFEGICSAHALVLRARENLVLKEFLPFFLQSETFFERALAISVGSLSPTINWKALAAQEFTIPPRDEQRRIAELLWAADEAVEKWRDSIAATNTARASLAKDLFKSQPKSSIGRLTDWVELNPKPSMVLADNLDVSFVAMADVSEDGGIINQVVRKCGEVKNGYTFFENGDIIFPKITPCMENGKGAIAETLTNGIGFGSTEFYILRPRLKSDTQFVYQLTRTDEFRRRARRTMRGSAGQQRVPRIFLENYRLPISSPEERTRIGSLLAELDGGHLQQKHHLDKLLRVRKEMLINLLAH